MGKLILALLTFGCARKSPPASLPDHPAEHRAGDGDGNTYLFVGLPDLTSSAETKPITVWAEMPGQSAPGFLATVAASVSVLTWPELSPIGTTVSTSPPTDRQTSTRPTRTPRWSSPRSPR